ncbi:GTPase involved in ribosome biogenesis [anaerobic digester metagenome]|mgnify:FL=1|jgi:ribosome biogenesis GTPase|uniref:GTPase involved in ribosome biogenesis n=1 Tax=anaerobic digester metagenome TaxID=1263854 RepID=A0A485M6U6_9ZZZZ
MENWLVSKLLTNSENLVEGIVLRGYSGHYYVHDGREEWECSLRGRFRREKQQTFVGDRVLLRPGHGYKGVIERMLPRSSLLVRPPVANVDQAIIVFAVREPDPNPWLLDRFLVLVSTSGVKPLICFNKVDLTKDGQVELVSRYREIYPLVVISAKTGEGLELLRQALGGKVSVFAGPSGVGKSTILNALHPGLALKTAELSAKLKRGRHTTRHVELIALPRGGFVADTPGFSSLDLPGIRPEELSGHFPEMDVYFGKCRFNQCLHHQEPDCAVKGAVESGLINKERYFQYLEFLKELKERRRY